MRVVYLTLVATFLLACSSAYANERCGIVRELQTSIYAAGSNTPTASLQIFAENGDILDNLIDQPVIQTVLTIAATSLQNPNYRLCLYYQATSPVGSVITGARLRIR